MRTNSPEEKMVKDLKEKCEMMSDFITGLLEDEKIHSEELRYLYGFLNYKNLEEEYHDFRRNAVEVYEEDMPFPYLTLK